MTEKSTEHQKAITEDAAARAALQAAERQLATARAEAAAIVPSAFKPTDLAGYEAAKLRADKPVAKAERAEEFLRDVARRAAEALVPHEKAHAQAEHAAAIAAVAQDLAIVPSAIEQLVKSLGPVAEAVAQVTAGRGAVAKAAAAVESLGERCEARQAAGDVELAQLCERIAARMRSGTVVEQLAAVAEVVKYQSAAPERERARREAAEERARAQHARWREEALRGGHGREAQLAAEQEVHEQAIKFHGPRSVIELRPKVSPEVAAYYANAGVKLED
ncbi:hypothetical protein [Anaeromyxobacter terrae]|uniref:hypothetical protein n=1 Tax=Anaeromyxobacter terrae TaxID=2925406 RepID=UPI001F5AA4A1|nr:hypothetical protein [Anaeromyxobacter sp. SG22]